MKEAHPPAELSASLAAAFTRPPENPLDDDEFDRLARRIFEWQFTRNSPYAAYCSRRGRTPDRVQHWTEIPAVPATAFKEVALIAGRVEDAEAVFRTSGTTRGTEKRGTHYVLDISVYDSALLAHFAAMVLPDGSQPVMFSLMPRPRDLPDSSLAHMIATVIDILGLPRSTWFATVAGGLDVDGLDQALNDARQRREPVCLLGTTAAFVHWFDALRESGRQYRLPEGSRLMDTGGFKGKGREVNADEIHRLAEQLLGVPPTHCVNEYGMTEMCSQFYDSTLRDLLVRRVTRERRKIGPAWVRTRVMDPETLEPLPAGTTGLLCHYDLANVGCVIGVQTEDLGIELDEGFQLVGRVRGASPRGCSIAMDELLAAVKDRNA